jgi:hypothetical protein
VLFKALNVDPRVELGDPETEGIILFFLTQMLQHTI